MYRDLTVDGSLPEAEDMLHRQMKELETLCKARDNREPKRSSGIAVHSTRAILALIDRESPTFNRRFTREPGERLFEACKALDQHDILFSILPKGMECASAFYGAMWNIVSVSSLYMRNYGVLLTLL